MPEFLLEIGFEEMPAPWLEGLSTQLQAKFTEAATGEFLEPKNSKVSWTPRRLVLRADVLARQADRNDPIWGPIRKIAKDSAGNWTRAAEGFAKKNGVTVEQLQFAVRGSEGVVSGKPAAGLTMPSEEHLLYVRPVSGRPALEILPAAICVSLRALAFPKRMSWDAWLDDGKGAFPFGRPIRWLVAMLEGTVIPFVIYEQADGARGKARVASGPTTLGHRFLPKGTAGRAQIVRTHSELQEALRRNFVLLDPAERAKKIAGELEALVGGGVPADDHGLRAEWRDLVEYPTVVEGQVPSQFRTLPREVLETVLVHHQKYIPLLSADGKVARFAAVINGDGVAAAEIVRGMERVVVARLRDASFFYSEDRKRPLGDRVGDLAGVTFHKGLGSYRDKADRMVGLVEAMASEGWLSGDQGQSAAEAARLAKADLTTLMVREFPELQGTMGALYLEAQGAPADVIKAVYWHYHPIFVGQNAVPAGAFEGGESRVFAAVSLADKLDTLAGYIGLGLMPTGSSDPFGLRRAAHGAIRAILDFWQPADGERRPSLERLLEIALDQYKGVKRVAADVIRDLEGFFLDRMEYVLRAREFPGEEVEAVLYVPGVDALRDPLDVLERLRALHSVKGESQEDFAHLATAFKRANNILQQAKSTGSLPLGILPGETFPEGPEKDLFLALEQTRQWHTSGTAAPNQKLYEQMLRSLASIRPVVDSFFDGVMVMDDDLEVRRRRLELMTLTVAPFNRIADISRLGGQS